MTLIKINIQLNYPISIIQIKNYPLNPKVLNNDFMDTFIEIQIRQT